MAAAPSSPPVPGSPTLPADVCRARILAGAYVLLLVYASLHPLQGWQLTPRGFWAMLLAPWPRYWTGFDVGANVLAYLPLGWLSYLAWRGYRAAAWRAIFLAALLSLSMEGVQNFLASRVASNLDIIANIVGAGLGVGMAWAVAGPRRGRAHVMASVTPQDTPRQLSQDAQAAAAWALVLLIYGVLAQAATAVAWLQFGTVTALPGSAGADLGRWLLDWAPPLWLAAGWVGANWFAAMQTAINVVLLGQVCQACGRQGAGWRAGCLLGALLAGGLGRVCLSGLQAGWDVGLDVFIDQALSVHGLVGVLCGTACALWVGYWPARARGVLSLSLAGVVLLLVLMQLGVSELRPSGPVVLDRPLVARHLQNFMGLLQFLAVLWPYLVWLWLLRYRPWRQI